MLEDTKRPIQFVFAGKAHPGGSRGQGADQGDRELRAQLAAEFRRRMVFIEKPTT
jgi:glucan phosphorylase